MSITACSLATVFISRVPRHIAGAILGKRNPGCYGSTRRPPFRLNSSLPTLDALSLWRIDEAHDSALGRTVHLVLARCLQKFSAHAWPAGMGRLRRSFLRT